MEQSQIHLYACGVNGKKPSNDSVLFACSVAVAISNVTDAQDTVVFDLDDGELVIYFRFGSSLIMAELDVEGQLWVGRYSQSDDQAVKLFMPCTLEQFYSLLTE